MTFAEPIVARTRGELAEGLAILRRERGTIGFVPTMGALHPGHLSLVERAKVLADSAVVSIFVNPTQFGAGEDLARYPRDLAGDLEQLAPHDVKLVFAPEVGEMYPEGESLIQVTPGILGDRLCGRFRPGHFAGVLTVVAKLFGLFRPDWAVFGRKDLQQAALIRRMVSDLELGVSIDVAPLVRESDGLAMSSRNRYLSPSERREATVLFRSLSVADDAFRRGAGDPAEIVSAAQEVLSQEPGVRLQYLEVVEPDRLDAVKVAERGSIVALAVFAGETRLIDNLVLGASVPDPIIPRTN